MFVKLNLILICASLFNISEVNCDCNDFIKCVGDWIGDLLTEDAKNTTVKAVDVPDVISAVGDIFSDITHLIEDTFKITKETSFATNFGNKTDIHIETFRFNDEFINNYNRSDDNEDQTLNIIDRNSSQANGTNNVVNNIFIDVVLKPKENETEFKYIENENENVKHNTESSIAPTGSDIITTTLSTDYNTTNIADSIKTALSGEYFTTNITLPEISSENIGFYNLNFTTIVEDLITISYGPPDNITDTIKNKTLNIENKNGSNIFINIPESVANNYKITFETPINVTYFEINTNQNINVETNSTLSTNNTNFTTKDNTNAIENQNVQENEIIALEYEFDDVVVDENATDYLAIDYIDLYKDTTNEDVEYTPATYIPTTTEANVRPVEVNDTNGISSVFPWIVTVFIKNNENSQFDYICDGALLSERVVLTAARCLMKDNVTVDVEDIIVILGKRSLQDTGANEKVSRVKVVKLHENFTAVEGKVDNDLAVIVLADPIAFNEDIQAVPLKNDNEVEAIESATTGWQVNGRLTPIFFDKESSKTCKKNTEALSAFCAVFGDNITTCPSYGGLFLARERDTEWSFRGITAGSPTNRGVCFNKNVTFTKISQYHQWITHNIKINKV